MNEQFKTLLQLKHIRKLRTDAAQRVFKQSVLKVNETEKAVRDEYLNKSNLESLVATEQKQAMSALKGQLVGIDQVIAFNKLKYRDNKRLRDAAHAIDDALQDLDASTDNMEQAKVSLSAAEKRLICVDETLKHGGF